MTMIPQKKFKKVALTKPMIKNHLFVFVNCLIENPAFDSQTKVSLTLQKQKFGSDCPLSEGFFKDGGCTPFASLYLQPVLWATALTLLVIAPR